MCNIPNRLQEERKRLKLNQEDMAKAGGISKRTFCHYEAGERSPDANFLAQIAAAGVDVTYILTGERAGQGEALTPRDKALLDNVGECSEEDRRAIERLALSIAKAESQVCSDTELKRAG